jgi:hypothetical protein
MEVKWATEEFYQSHRKTEQQGDEDKTYAEAQLHLPTAKLDLRSAGMCLKKLRQRLT